MAAPSLAIAACAAGLLLGGGAPVGAAPSPRADLSVGLADAPDPVNVSSPLVYSISVVNHGPSPADKVKLIDKLPRTYVVSSVAPSTGKCKVAGRTVSCNLGRIGIGTGATVPIVTITGIATRKGRIVNSVTVSSRRPDPRPGNNLATEPTRVRQVRVPRCAGKRVTLLGTTGSDRLVGTRGNDVVVAWGGDDVIRTFKGHDVICGGRGDDIIRAGIWADRVFGNAGHDRLLGGGGHDRLKGNRGDDRLLGRSGNDVLIGGRGFDVCKGNRGRDKFRNCERRRR